MAQGTATPKLTAATLAWLKACNGVTTNIDGYPTTIDASGNFVVGERAATVTTTLLCTPPAGLLSDITAGGQAILDDIIKHA